MSATVCFGLVQDPDRVLEDGSTALRQQHPPLRAHEEGLTQLRLQRLDLVADRRLREAEALGSSSEVQRLRNNLQRLELRELHARTVT